MAMAENSGDGIVIPARYNGPPSSGNGGYVCGRVAALVDGAQDDMWPEVTLRLPPPLDTPLEVHRNDGGVSLLHEGTVIAEGRLAPGAGLDIPAVPDTQAILEARSRFAGFAFHPLATCFVCGTEREEGDGLCLYTGPVSERSDGLVACGWVPHAAHGDESGRIPPEIVWSALDCPGAFAIDAAIDVPLKLLGRLSARVHRQPRVGEPLVALGWYLGSDGRKHRAGTAIVSPSGDTLGEAIATWIELKR